MLEIQTTLPDENPALISAHEPILVVTMSGVAETFKTVIAEMTHATDFQLVKLLHPENVNLTYEDLYTSIDEPQNPRNIHLLLYDNLTSTATPSHNGRLLHCSWSFGMFDHCH